MASMFGAAVGGKASHVEMLKVITEKLKVKMAEDGVTVLWLDDRLAGDNWKGTFEKDNHLGMESIRDPAHSTKTGPETIAPRAHPNITPGARSRLPPDS